MDSTEVCRNIWRLQYRLTLHRPRTWFCLVWNLILSQSCEIVKKLFFTYCLEAVQSEALMKVSLIGVFGNIMYDLVFESTYGCTTIRFSFTHPTLFHLMRCRSRWMTCCYRFLFYLHLIGFNRTQYKRKLTAASMRKHGTFSVLRLQPSTGWFYLSICIITVLSVFTLFYFLWREPFK